MLIQLWVGPALQQSLNGAAFDWKRVFSIFDISQAIYTTLIIVLTVYLGKRLYTRKRYGLALLAFFGLIMAFIGIRYLLEQVLFPILFGKANYFDVTALYYIQDNISYALITIFLGALVYFADESLTQIQNNRLLGIKTREAELQFLRAQLNPHFLYNSLNNIYALVQTKSEGAGPALLQLTELTRYAGSRQSDLVLIKDEMYYAEQYIALQRLRLSYPVDVQMDIDTSVQNCQIPPFTIITLLENAFKHGELQGSPLQLHISLQKDELCIQVQNRLKKNRNKDTAGGVGLSNIRQRLVLLYPNESNISAEEQGDWFNVQIKIPCS